MKRLFFILICLYTGYARAQLSLEEPQFEIDESQTSASCHQFSASLSIVSDYRFRGISQTMRQPAVQGLLQYSHLSGFYLKTFASNVDGTSDFFNNTSMEWEFFGGFKGALFPCWNDDFTFDVGLIYYYFPGGQAFVKKHVPYNTCEYYAGLTYKWFNVRFWQTLTNSFAVNGDNPPMNWNKKRYCRRNGNSCYSTYIEANATFNLWNEFYIRCLHGGKLTLLLHAGKRVIRNYDQLNYTDWEATLNQQFVWFDLFLTYVGTNARSAYYDVPDHAYHPKKKNLGSQGVVVGIERSF